MRAQTLPRPRLERNIETEAKPQLGRCGERVSLLVFVGAQSEG